MFNTFRSEAKILLDNAQKKLDTAQSTREEILKQAKKDGDNLIIELNNKCYLHNSMRLYFLF